MRAFRQGNKRCPVSRHSCTTRHAASGSGVHWRSPLSSFSPLLTTKFFNFSTRQTPQTGIPAKARRNKTTKSTWQTVASSRNGWSCLATGPPLMPWRSFFHFASRQFLRFAHLVGKRRKATQERDRSPVSTPLIPLLPHCPETRASFCLASSLILPVFFSLSSYRCCRFEVLFLLHSYLLLLFFPTSPRRPRHASPFRRARLPVPVSSPPS